MIARDYNTQRKKMKLPEYGRSIHKMVDHIMQIENREERILAVKGVIDVMGMMYPYLRDINEFKHKLWDHIAIMSDFKLDIDYPYDPPKPETFIEKPKLVPYGQKEIKFRHYGKIMENYIAATALLPDENPAKAVNIELLANQMKKTYLVWNKDAVEDSKILTDLTYLSHGSLKPNPDLRLQEVNEIFKQQVKKGRITPTSNQSRKHK
ncbi:MAG: DUF4290 domain-containing protein [Bacteroidia bacterium]|nr:DUF4290 domain-containing protein [Bacteroidia bacterium]